MNQRNNVNFKKEFFMANGMQATDAVAQDTISASGEFDALLNQAFDPRLPGRQSRGSRSADAGATGAGEHDHRKRERAYKKHQRYCAQIDFKLTERDQTDSATSPRLAEAGILVARYGASGLQLTETDS